MKNIKKWRIFFESGWFEYWCGELVKSIVKKDGTVSVDIQCKRLDKTERECQIDVAVIRGHRLYIISCTTEAEGAHICKNKLFEVAVRARQLGGDLARSAMVSLIHGTIKQKKQGKLRDILKIDLLKGDIADLWESSNEIKACGLDDVRAWIGTYGDPKVHDFKQWLES